MTDPATDSKDRTAEEFETAAQERAPTLVGELWQFIKDNKAWWMIPILVSLGILGILIVLGSTGAAPFIYTLF